jgi:flagellin
MARINTNVSALTAQRHLGISYRELNTTMEHLSTGLRIARGKDDPAGLIVSERLRSEISAVNQA